MFHQTDDLRNGTLTKGLRGADTEDTGEVHAAGDDLVAHIHVAGQRLSRQGHGIKGTRTFYDHSVEGDFLARTDDDDGADGDGGRTDVLIPQFNMRHIRPYIHQMGDTVAGLTLGVALEELADLEEEHHEDRFRILGLGFGEETDTEGTDGGDGHEEVLVEGIAVGDALPSLVQRLVAYQ